MTTAIATREAEPLDAKIVEQVLLGGDLSKLSPAQRLNYYNSLCQSLGLNPLTKPFEYLTLSGKTVLYARKDATEQLRKNNRISVTIKARELTDDCYVVTAQARYPDGREDESIGAVALGTLKGEAKANAMMKAETKAKRRVTLSICGLGMLDETEVETIPGAHVGEPAVTVEPDGYQDWCDTLASVADEGSLALRTMWDASKLEYRKHLTMTNRDAWESLKKRAEKVKVANDVA